jgi:hypothetical protein
MGEVSLTLMSGGLSDVNRFAQNTLSAIARTAAETGTKGSLTRESRPGGTTVDTISFTPTGEDEDTSVPVTIQPPATGVSFSLGPVAESRVSRAIQVSFNPPSPQPQPPSVSQTDSVTRDNENPGGTRVPNEGLFVSVTV